MLQSIRQKKMMMDDMSAMRGTLDNSKDRLSGREGTCICPRARTVPVRVKYTEREVYSRYSIRIRCWMKAKTSINSVQR